MSRARSLTNLFHSGGGGLERTLWSGPGRLLTSQFSSSTNQSSNKINGCKKINQNSSNLVRSLPQSRTNQSNCSIMRASTILSRSDVICHNAHQVCHSSSSTGSSNNAKNIGSSGKGSGFFIPRIAKRNVVTSRRIAETPAYPISRRMEETKLLSDKERAEFNALFPELIDVLTSCPELRDMPDTNRWLVKVMQYNVPHGKQNRGLSMALAYRYLSKDLTAENVNLSYVLAWCVEMLQAFFLVADDIMDASETRRGRLCWYKVEEMGPTAFNDAILLEAAIYPLLKHYFGEKDYYIDLIELFHEATFKTCYGQSLDTRTGIERCLEKYTLDRYAAIVKYKTSYYSFYLPVFLAMTMAGIRDAQAHEQARAILLEMGHFFQVQDDYLDCYGDTEVTGKIGTDIADCKCSWLVVMALQKANAAQRQIILDNYGKDNQEKMEIIKQLYLELGIPEIYLEFEDQTYNSISTQIDQLSASLPKKLFRDMIDKLYRRSR